MVTDSGDPVESGSATNSSDNIQQSLAGDWESTGIVSQTNLGIQAGITPAMVIDTRAGVPFNTIIPALTLPLDSFIGLQLNLGSQFSSPQISNPNCSVVYNILNHTSPSRTISMYGGNYGFDLPGNYFTGSNIAITASAVMNPQFSGPSGIDILESGIPCNLPFYFSGIGPGSFINDGNTSSGLITNNGCLGFASGNPAIFTCLVPVTPGTWTLTLSQGFDFTNAKGSTGTVSVSGVVVAHLTLAGITELGPSGNPGFNNVQGTLNIVVTKAGYLVIALDSFILNVSAGLGFLHA